ncbi:hypothetical protein GGH99_003400, partial [Coemansia sp. RSA 1285]
MSNTPHRPAARRGLRKHGSRGDVAPAVAAAANHAGAHTRRKNMTPLRSYASFPALVAEPPAPPAFNIDELCAAKRPASNTAAAAAAAIADGDSMPGARHPGYGGRRGLLQASVSSGDADDFDLGTPPPPFSRRPAAAPLLPPLPGDAQLQRTPSERRRAGYSQHSLLGCLTPTPARTMMVDSPAGMHSVHSVSPSPSPTPYHASRTTHRRLTFTPAEMAAVAASGSVAGHNSVSSSHAGGASPASHQLGHAPSTMFTPPATKLVRPDPSVFTSTGLLSKKQQARARSSSGNNGSSVGGGDSDSFIPPETPCKRAGAAVDSAGKPAAAGCSMKVSSNDPRFDTGGGRARAHSGMATPNASSSSSVYYQSPALNGVQHLDMDPFRLGKHRNTSTDSLRRTRKKPHLGPPADELDDINMLFDTPCRPRQNTLVDDGFMQRPPPGFRIPGGAEAPPPLATNGSAARPLPPSFAPQHQFLIQSLAAGNLVDPDAAPWDIGSSAGSRVSWAASSDAGSISSAVTLAPSARSPVLRPLSGVADDSGAHRRQQQSSNARQTPHASRRQRIPLFRKDSTGSSCG